jgi:membrane protease YdiL (CAAX protease family)
MAAVMEEPLFRGFLWGYLRIAKLNNFWIWIFQALFFTAGHVYYLPSEPLGTWFIRMILPALLLGLIAWGAKSIFASMVTHGTFNAVSDMLAHSGSLQDGLMISWQAVIILLGILGVLIVSGRLRVRSKDSQIPQ